MKYEKIRNIIRESVYNLLNEYSSEQRLPFDDDKFKNKNYLEQYTDWLEDFGKYGTLPPSSVDFWDELKKGMKYIYDNDLEYNFRLNVTGNMEHSYNFIVERQIMKYAHVNRKGQVYVERAVNAHKLPSDYDPSDTDGKDPMAFYHTLADKFEDNVGGCWSYREGEAKIYCGKDFKSDKVPLVFRGYIRADDIDYVKTLLLNGKYFDEYEIRVKPNAKVEIFDVIYNKEYHLPLKGRLIVNSTYFGNNGQYYGNYAPVDDGFGNIRAIDRKGKIKDIREALQDALAKEVPFNDIFDKIIYLENGKFFGRFCNKYFLVNEDGTLGRGDNSFFDEVEDFGSEKMTRVSRNDKGYSFIDLSGKLIDGGRMWFKNAMNVEDGCAVVKNDDGKCSFIDSHGNLCEKWFKDMTMFSDGYACVQRDDYKWSFIDKKGNLLWNGTMWFDSVSEFEDGYASITHDDIEYIIDKRGKFYDYFTFEEIPSPYNSTNEELSQYNMIIKEALNRTIANYLLYN